MPASNRYLVAFDFDWTLVDEDSDRFVFGQLSAPLLQKLYALHNSTQWTDLMGILHEELHKQGTPQIKILETYRSIPFHPATAEALQLAVAHGAELIVISDANTVAIDEILKANGIRDLFSRIITNPAQFDEDGCLRIRRLIDQGQPQHNCPNGCAVNICKGKELLDHIDKNGPYKRVIYVGDGRNDLCPATKLNREDYILPRVGHALASILAPTETEVDPTAPDPVGSVPKSAKRKVDAQIKLWGTGSDLYQALNELLAEQTDL